MRFLSLTLFLVGLSTFAQDITGTWIGKCFQAADREYYFEIRIDEVSSDGKVIGTTFVKEESTGNFGTITYTGTYTKPVFTFNEIEIVKQDKDNTGGYYDSNFWYWCIKKGKLNLSEENGMMYLKGPWTAAGSCDGGTIEVSKKETNENPIETSDCGELHSAEFMIGAWRGKFHQHSCNVFETFPMIVLIDRFDGMKFYGQFIWTDMTYAEDSRSTLEGEIKDGYAYFYENELISGGGLVLNGTYKSKIINCDELSGHWYLDKLQGGCQDAQVLKNGGDYDLEHYVIPTIYFDHESAKLTDKATTYLNEFFEFMKQFPSMKFDMSGHTDNTGSSAFNMNLPRKRAQQVIEYLVSKGIKSDRFTYSYHAHTKPVEKNNSVKNMQLNRRVEIELLPGE